MATLEGNGGGNNIPGVDAENDSIWGQGGNDTLRGGPAAGTGGGNDLLDGGEGADLIYGGTGDDTLIAGNDTADDTLYGGDGVDTVDYSRFLTDLDPSAIFSPLTNSMTVNLATGFVSGRGADRVFGIENVITGSGNDVITGSTAANLLNAGAGADRLYGGVGIDTLIGGDGIDTLYGGVDNDVLYGGNDADRLYGGTGTDTLVGGEGADFLDGGLGSDTADYSASSGAVAVNLNDAAAETGGHAAGDTLTGIENIIGSGGDDTLTGSNVANEIFGGAGADSIVGNLGSDSIEGGAGNDTINAGPDTISGGAPAPTNEFLDWTAPGSFNGQDLPTSFTQDTGTMSVTVNYVPGVSDAFDVSTFTLFSPETLIGDNSGALLSRTGAGELTELSINFAAEAGSGMTNEVSNVLFRINDIDENGWRDTVNVLAYDELGNLVPVSITTTSSSISITGNNATASGVSTNPDQAAGSVLVSIAGPVAQIVIQYSDLLNAGQFIIVSDIHFTTIPATPDTSDADTVSGGLGDDLIEAGLGADIISGDEGLDTLYGEAGADTLYGGVENDFVYGGTENDLLYGGAAVDRLYGEAGADTLYGGTEGDLLYGGSENDSVFGDAGADTMYGDAGNDALYGGSENDLVYGGTGNDVLYGDAGADTLYGEAENDLLYGGADGDLAYGGLGEDTLYGDGGSDSLFGGDANDQIFGGLGADSIEAGGGTDLVYGGDANDTINFGTGDDTVYGGAGDDVIDDQPGDILTGVNLIYGGAGNDTIWSGLDAETVYGDEGNDVINGEGGGDLVYGGIGNDTIDAGSGNDVLTGGAGTDSIFGGDDRDEILVTYNASANDALGNESVDGGSGAGTSSDNDTLRVDITGFGWTRINLLYDPLNAENGTITFLAADGTTVVGILTFTEIENLIIVCFTAGTQIMTERGAVAVEDLVPGEMVLTRDNGMQPLRWVGHRVLSASELMARPELQPVRIGAGALGAAGPERSMMLSPQHRVLVEGARSEIYFGEPEVLVPAKHLVGLAEVTRALPEDGVTYVHILFDRHEIVQSDGLWTESFQPAERTLNALDAAARAEVLDLFPELASDMDGYPAARLSLKAHEARVLISD